MAFVLLLLSLAASFAFGLMIGKGQADDRLVVQKETPVVTEASLAPKKNDGQIVELGVESSDFEAETTTETTEPVAPVTETMSTATVVEEAAPVTETAAGTPAGQPAETPAVPSATAAAPATPVVKVTTYAQLLSTSDQKTAERMAASLIDRGFDAAYVERGTSAKGPIFRVRVRFDSEAAARAAEPKLREVSKEVWITTK